MNELDSVSTMKERKLKILAQKNEERKIKFEKQKKLKTKEIVDEENINYILTKFEQLEKDISAYLKQVEDVNIPKESLPELFDSCYCKLENWQNLISLTGHVLKIYHKKQFQNKYHELNDKRLKLEQTLMPEKKFSFKKSPNENLKRSTDDKRINLNYTEDVVDTITEKVPKKYTLDFGDEFGFSFKEGEILNLSYEKMLKKDAVFRNLKNCQMNILGGANTIHFISLTDCRVLCGPISTSIFVENCRNCTLVLACQQLRVHQSFDCNFYIHVTSRAIIEDCKGICFAPYNWKYENIEKHFESVDLNINCNNWNLVNDFNWLSSTQSPNWRIIAEEERVSDWS